MNKQLSQLSKIWLIKPLGICSFFGPIFWCRKMIKMLSFMAICIFQQRISIFQLESPCQPGFLLWDDGLRHEPPPGKIFGHDATCSFLFCVSICAISFILCLFDFPRFEFFHVFPLFSFSFRHLKLRRQWLWRSWSLDHRSAQKHGPSSRTLSCTDSIAQLCFQSGALLKDLNWYE